MSYCLYSVFRTLLGDILLVSKKENVLTGLYFMNQHYMPKVELHWYRADELAFFIDIKYQINAYFKNKLHSFNIPYEFHTGTPFQKKVWDALATVPYGNTQSYSDLAQTVGNFKAVRAVGSAVGKNPLSIIIPCHRIIACNGDIAGYAGGLHRKRFLINLEQGKTASVLSCV